MLTVSLWLGIVKQLEDSKLVNVESKKVYEVDTHSAIAIAGVAGPCIDMAKLFQTQLGFYEKIEGSHLSLEGKASYLSNMLKSNLLRHFRA